MSDNTPAAPSSDPVAPPEPAADDPNTRPDREAAKYRKQLRDVEASRDQLAGRLAIYERAHVERLAAERLTTPADLWLVLGDDLDQLRDQDGNLDEQMVRGAVETVVTERPTWDKASRPKVPAPNPAQGSAGTPPEPTGADAFAGMIANVVGNG